MRGYKAMAIWAKEVALRAAIIVACIAVEILTRPQIFLTPAVMFDQWSPWLQFWRPHEPTIIVTAVEYLLSIWLGFWGVAGLLIGTFLVSMLKGTWGVARLTYATQASALLGYCAVVWCTRRYRIDPTIHTIAAMRSMTLALLFSIALRKAVYLIVLPFVYEPAFMVLAPYFHESSFWLSQLLDTAFLIGVALVVVLPALFLLTNPLRRIGIPIKGWV